MCICSKKVSALASSKKKRKVYQWRIEGETKVKGAENVTRLQGPGRLGENEGGTERQTGGAQREKSI